MKSLFFILKMVIISTFIVAPANAQINKHVDKEGAAPYTKEALDKILAIQRNMKLDKVDERASQLEKTKIFIDYNRQLFAKAGYDFDDTIDQVVDDLRFHREKMTTSILNNSVAGFILLNFSMILPDCKYYQIDCVHLFRSKTAESVKWLSEQNPSGSL